MSAWPWTLSAIENHRQFSQLAGFSPYTARATSPCGTSSQHFKLHVAALAGCPQSSAASASRDQSSGRPPFSCSSIIAIACCTKSALASGGWSVSSQAHRSISTLASSVGSAAMSGAAMPFHFWIRRIVRMTDFCWDIDGFGFPTTYVHTSVALVSSSLAASISLLARSLL